MDVEYKNINNLTLKNKTFEDVDFLECTFNNCRFSDLSLVNLRFNSCNFKNCVITSFAFKYCSSFNCFFSNCSILNISWNLLQSSRILPVVKGFKDCTLKYNNFIRLQLSKMDFSSCNILDCYFDECILTKSNFTKADLQKSVFTGCDLREADFTNSHNYLIDIKTNRIKGAKFTYPEALNLLTTLDIIIK